LKLCSLPYFPNTTDLIDALSTEEGLIWYHNGPNTLEQEWLSAWPSQTYLYHGNREITEINDAGVTSKITADWIEFLKTKTENIPEYRDSFSGGLAGHFSYDLGLEFLNITTKHSNSSLPLATVSKYHWSIIIHHEEKECILVIQPGCPDVILNKLEALQKKLKTSDAKKSNKETATSQWHCSMQKQQYDDAFQKIKKYILEGDAYQVNLTRQWSTTDKQLNDWELYKKLTHAMPAPFSVFHRTNTHTLLSVSPERFIQVRNDLILTQPIKGTRPRSNNPTQDTAYKSELFRSEKDRAENLMIVDLLRNDIAKNSIPGSINVEKLFEVQSFRNVHHLVSSITAKKSHQSHALDVLRDAFPGGSITGTPKKRAMEIIDEVEQTLRGNYCGCSFYITNENSLDSNILIRTMTLTENTLTCNGGGGIVFDSELASEFEESDVKVRKLLDTVASD
jgi:para-aminobenzoate synthetase component 1